MEKIESKNMDMVKKTFDEWAKNGRSELMEKEHGDSVLKLLKSVNFKRKFSFLDIGCGNGWVVRRIASKKQCREAVGIDKSLNMIKLAKSLSNSKKETYVKADLKSWKSKKKFDYVFSMESLYYVESIEESLKKIHAMLKPNGVFFCGTDFYKDNKATSIWSKKMKLKMHLLSKEEWKKNFNNAGFQTRTRQIKNKYAKKKWRRQFGTLFVIGSKISK